MQRPLFLVLGILLLVPLVTASVVPTTLLVLLWPQVNNAHQPNTAFTYNFVFSTTSSCDVLLNTSMTVTTDAEGLAVAELNITNLTQVPSFLCEYRNGNLRAVHALNPALFLNQTNDAISIVSGTYARANTTCSVNGTNCPVGNNGTGISSITVLQNGSLQINLTNGVNITTGNLTGSTGPQGATGPTGSTGSTGAPGADGTNGLNGSDGRNGTSIQSMVLLDNGSLQINLTDGTSMTTSNLTGLPGIQGPAGNAGTNGTNGATGNPGTNGTGIASISLLTNGSLQINLTNGLNITTGNLTGAQGNQGTTGNTGLAGTNGQNGTNGNNAASNWTIANSNNASVINQGFVVNITNGAGITSTLSCAGGTCNLTITNTGVLTETDPAWTGNQSLYVTTTSLAGAVGQNLTYSLITTANGNWSADKSSYSTTATSKTLFLQTNGTLTSNDWCQWSNNALNCNVAPVVDTNSGGTLLRVNSPNASIIIVQNSTDVNATANLTYFDSRYYLGTNPLGFYNTSTLPASGAISQLLVNISTGNTTTLTNNSRLSFLAGSGINLALSGPNITITNTGLLSEVDPAWTGNQSSYTTTVLADARYLRNASIPTCNGTDKLTSAGNGVLTCATDQTSAGSAQPSGWLNTSTSVYLASNTTNVSIGNTSGLPAILYVDNTNGRVGIGNTTPAARLEVNGAINASTVAATTLFGALTGNAATATTASNLASGTYNYNTGSIQLNANVSNNATQFQGYSTTYFLNLTGFNAANLTSGNIPIAQFPTGGTWTLTTNLVLNGANITTNGNLNLSTAGRTIIINNASNGCAGIAKLSSGSSVVNTTCVAAQDLILLNLRVNTTTPMPAVGVSALLAGVSFTIRASNASEAGNVSWLVVKTTT